MSLTLARAAALVVNQSVRLEADENAVLIADTRIDRGIIESLRQALLATGADVAELLLAEDSDDVTGRVAGFAPLNRADVVIAPVGRSLTYDPTLAQVRARGGRVLSMPRLTRDVFEQLATTDVAAMLATTKRLAELFARGPSVLELRSELGTRFAIDIGGCRLEVIDGVVEAGEIDQLPAGVVSVVGRHGRGEIVIDGPVSVLDRVDQPIRLRIEESTIVEIDGGESARHLAALLDSFADRGAARHCPAEIGIGTNPAIAYVDRDRFVPALARAVGVVHVGFGDDHLFHDGSVVAPIHGDFIVKDVEVWLDGVKIAAEPATEGA